MRITCMKCGKTVSTPVPEDTVISAWVECPDCIEEERIEEESQPSDDRTANDLKAVLDNELNLSDTGHVVIQDIIDKLKPGGAT